MVSHSDFEEPIRRLKTRIAELEGLPESSTRKREIQKLTQRLEKVSREIYQNLSPWQKTLVARHPNRPFCLDYVRVLCRDFVELHGDRTFSDDSAVVTGFGIFGDQPVAIIGHQKGRDTKEKIRRNFGMARPEGYRKALRILKLAEKFNRPVITFIDTPGAYPGLDSEERGVSEAIARNLLEMSLLETPIISIVIGEGGSGGALGIGLADRILMLEHSVYSVISPEGCAAILWKDQSKAQEAAEALRLTAADCKALGVADEVIPEPVAGAHSNPLEVIDTAGRALRKHLAELQKKPIPQMLDERHAKFRQMGAFELQASGR